MGVFEQLDLWLCTVPAIGSGTEFSKLRKIPKQETLVNSSRIMVYYLQQKSRTLGFNQPPAVSVQK